MSDSHLYGFFIGMCVPFFFLYNRKWLPEVIVYTLTSSMFVAGIIIVLLDSNFTLTPIAWGLCIPLIIFLLDRFFKRISVKFHNRDLILWIRDSSEIDNSMGAKNHHVLLSDKLFSIGLLVLIFTLSLSGLIAL